ncbi:hypothetical protein KKH23_06710 [Patescibacteria group bacterium]|nr:hypothetical protein [Patescibacteria group bacterium]
MELDTFVEECKVASRHATSLQELADAIGVPRTTVDSRLRRAGYKPPLIEALRSELSLESLESVDVVVRQSSYLRKVVKRLEGQIADRNWLKTEVAGQMSVMEPIRVEPPPPSTGDFQAQTSCLELSDIHYGVDIPEGALGPLWGNYNTDIAETRVVHTVQEFVRLSHQQSFPVDKAVLFILGDTFEHSNMRMTQAKSTSIHVVKQAIGMCEILIPSIRMVCSQFEEVEVVAVPGNHGRATQRAKDSLPDESFEHFMYYAMDKALSAQPNLTFIAPSTWYHIHQIYSYKFLALHGEDALSWAGIPWYGIKRLVQDYGTMAGHITKQRLRQMPMDHTMTVGEFLGLMDFPDYVTIGHFHDPVAWTIMGIGLLANGAMSGASHYSAKNRHNVTPPSQKMWYVHPDHGVRLQMDIDLEEVF